MSGIQSGSLRRIVGRTGRGVGLASLVLVIVAILAGLVAASPWALRLIGDTSTEWNRLSMIGQTYGAASALIAAVALVGVVASLTFQAKENKSNREESARAFHTELLKMAMDDDTYRRCWGPFFASDDFDAAREHMYVNLIISNWQMRWELKVLGEPDLRSGAYTLFSGGIGARFWADGRELRAYVARSRRERRFHAILDEEYERARNNLAAPPSGQPKIAQAGTLSPHRPVSRRSPVTFLAGGVAGIACFALAKALRRRTN